MLCLHKPTKKIFYNFFDLLEKHRLTDYKQFPKFNVKTQYILKNIQESGKTYKEFEKVFNDQHKLKQFSDNNKDSFSIDEIHSRRLIANYFIFHSLNYIEAHRLFLIENLKIGAKIGKKKQSISLKMPLGTLIVGISQEICFNDFQNLFPKDLRNMLGHSSWWWEHGKFVYEDDKGILIKVSFPRYTAMMNIFSKNMCDLVTEWISRIPKSKKSTFP